MLERCFFLISQEWDNHKKKGPDRNPARFKIQYPMKNRLGMNEICASPFFSGKRAVFHQIRSGKWKSLPGEGESKVLG